MTTMTLQEKRLEAYNEAKLICVCYKTYRGDKRSIYYKELERSVIDVYMNRMTTFGAILGLPTFHAFFYK